MKNYEIIAGDEKARKEIKERIHKLDLETRLKITHPAPEDSCALEVHYKVMDGGPELNEIWSSGSLKVYVNEKKPSIHIWEALWVGYDLDSYPSLGAFQLEGTLIKLYVDTNEILPE